MAIGIAEVNRMRDAMVLKVKSDSALFQFLLRSFKILSIRAQGEMEDTDSGWTRLTTFSFWWWERRQSRSRLSRRRSECHPSFLRVAAPDREPQDTTDRFFDIAHRERNVIQSLKFHLNKRIAAAAVSVKNRRVRREYSFSRPP